MGGSLFSLVRKCDYCDRSIVQIAYYKRFLITAHSGNVSFLDRGLESRVCGGGFFLFFWHFRSKLGRDVVRRSWLGSMVLALTV